MTPEVSHIANGEKKPDSVEMDTTVKQPVLTVRLWRCVDCDTAVDIVRYSSCPECGGDIAP